MITRLEELGMNAWPAFQTLHVDGWVLRFADGASHRANSIYPLYPSSYPSSLPVKEKIHFCEALYRARGLPPAFKLTERVFPPDLDTLLEDLGYLTGYHISVQTLELSGLKPVLSRDIQAQPSVDEAWLEQLFEFYSLDPQKKSAYQKILDLIELPKSLVRLVLDGQVVGCGVGVLEDSYLGLFDIAVDKSFRNRGCGRIIVDHLLAWGKGLGAQLAYLQVAKGNLAAVRLYEKRGFREAYQYWYRQIG